MDLKATIASGYRTRLILIAAATLLYAAWSIYDATITYPDRADAREAFEDVKAKHPDTWNEYWPDVAKENGWDGTKEPQALETYDIPMQWIQFVITITIGTYCSFSLIKWSRRFVGADAEKIYANGGVEFNFDQITSIDATRWESKGIARVRYDAGAGEKELVIDDWKYEREPTDAVFSRIREHVDADKITGLTTPAAPVEDPADEQAPVADAEQGDAEKRPTA